LELDARAELFLSKLKRQIEKDIPIEILGAPQPEEEAGKGSSLSDKIVLRIAQQSIPQLKSDQMMSLDQIKGQSSNVLGAIGGSVKKKSEVTEHIKAFLDMSHPEFLDLIAQMKGFEAETGEIYICILFDLLLY